MQIFVETTTIFILKLSTFFFYGSFDFYVCLCPLAVYTIFFMSLYELFALTLDSFSQTKKARERGGGG